MCAHLIDVVTGIVGTYFMQAILRRTTSTGVGFHQRVRKLCEVALASTSLPTAAEGTQTRKQEHKHATKKKEAFRLSAGHDKIHRCIVLTVV